MFRTEVADFLRVFKSCIDVDRLHIKNRDVNAQTLIDLDLTVQQRKEILLALTPDHYHKGPVPDDTDDTKDVWVFGYFMDEKEIYIKLRVVENPRGCFNATVWSFHPAEYRLSYPLKGEEK